MTNEQMLAALAALPDPEMLTESKITDPLGSDSYYSARTVVKLLAAERERCAKLCEAMGPVMCESYGDGAECIATADACAEAIRRA